MFASTFRSRARRRGIILVVVLGMLALLALIGVTFATFANQAKINAINFASNGRFPTAGELMDYALAQLIEDTANPQSVIRGHSLKRDMYGLDAQYNGALLNGFPDGSGPIVITGVATTPMTSGPWTGLYKCVTNIPTTTANGNAAAFFPYTNGFANNYFQRWIIRVPPQTILPNSTASYSINVTDDTGNIDAVPFPNPNDKTLGLYIVGQTYEIMGDDVTDSSGYRVFYLPPSYYNPSMPPMIFGYNNPAIGLNVTMASTLAQYPLINIPVTLDGRFLRAFNGAGMGSFTDAEGHPLSEYANFRYNGNALFSAVTNAANQQTTVTPAMGNPNSLYVTNNNGQVIQTLPDMDEDYDACDLENWFMAIQSADGQVIIPSFHRPGLLTPLDWQVNAYQINNQADLLANTRAVSKILRPRQADGNNPTSFPDLVPDHYTGKITFDVDNDGDGQTDSVWLDLGYPPQMNTQGQYFKPLFSFMVIGLNGKIPINTAGNLQNLDGTGVPTHTHAGHLGNSPSEIDMTFALQNAFDQNWAVNTYFYVNGQSPTNPPTYSAATFTTQPPDPTKFYATNASQNPPYPIFVNPNGTSFTNAPYTQVDNAATVPIASMSTSAAIPKDVATTQLRNILAGTRQPTIPTASATVANGDANVVIVNGQPITFGNNIADNGDSVNYNNGPNPIVTRNSPAVAGRWGESSGVPSVFVLPTQANGSATGDSSRYNNPVRAGLSYVTRTNSTYPLYVITGLATNGATFISTLAVDICDDTRNATDLYPSPVNAELADYYDPSGQLGFAAERIRRFVTPVDVSGDGRVEPYIYYDFSQMTQKSIDNYNNYQSASSLTSLTTFAGDTVPYNFGGDVFGRVSHSHYFRPAGVPLWTWGNIPGNAAPGNTDPTIQTPLAPIFNHSFNQTGKTFNNVTSQVLLGTIPQTQPKLTLTGNILIDQTSNRTHGFESYRNPGFFNTYNVGFGTENTTKASADQTGLFYGAAPIDWNDSESPVATILPSNLQSPNQMRIRTASTTGITWANPVATYPNGTRTYSPFVNANSYVNAPDVQASGEFVSPSLNEADEMNLYGANSYDAPYTATDLEWLYRLQDVDGGSLFSRLSLLAPISFLNPLDGLRHRRLFALDTFDTTTFAWSPDNTAGGNQFGTNASFSVGHNAGLLHLPTTNALTYEGETTAASSSTVYGELSGTATTGQLGVPTPPLAHRDRRINLNYPVPVSNSPIEPLRQKWIRETYTLLKSILPPSAVDTPEELAQLSQYVVNIMDFRDPDSTCTKFVNTDIIVVPPSKVVSTTEVGSPSELFFYNRPPSLPPNNSAPMYPVPTNLTPYDPTYREPLTTSYDATSGKPMSSNYLVQYGMEYNPVAINEVLTYQFNAKNGTGTGATPLAVQRMFIEMVNMLVEDAATSAPASSLDLTGWDLVVMQDDNFGRPDPYTGQIPAQPAGGATAPFSQINPVWFSGKKVSTQPSPVGQGLTTPMPALLAITQAGGSKPTSFQGGGTSFITPGTGGATIGPDAATNYYYVLSNTSITPSGVTGADGGTLPTMGMTNLDISDWTSTPTNMVPGYYYWLYVRRPANPFDNTSVATSPNPYPNDNRVVVDAFRFVYTTATTSGKTVSNPSPPPSTIDQQVGGTGNDYIFSLQRFQPNRGGHAVPPIIDPLNSLTAGDRTSYASRFVATALGYSEQTTNATTQVPAFYGQYGTVKTTGTIYNTLGKPNIPVDDSWDYFPFNDRDFTSPMELLLVPGCPPGLFTKQFTEQAPGSTFSFGKSGTPGPGQNAPLVVPAVPIVTGTAPTNPGPMSTAVPSTYWTTTPWVPAASVTGWPNEYKDIPYTGTPPVTQTIPHTFPYLNDEFFYSGAYEPSPSGQYPYPPPLKPHTTTPAGVTAGLISQSLTSTSILNTNDTGRSVYIGGPGAAGWYKMLEFFEVPSPVVGATGPAASGSNYDWLRQDLKPGQINLNLIIDEEVFLALFGKDLYLALNQNQVPLPSPLIYDNPYFAPTYANPNLSFPTTPYVGANYTPAVVTQTTVVNSSAPMTQFPSLPSQGALNNQVITTGTPQTGQNSIGGTFYNMPNVGYVDNFANFTYISPFNKMKAAFSDFLKIRHGGSGYIFAFGNGLPGESGGVDTNGNIHGVAADRPFRSLSYPDINYTILRPASIPPSAFTNPALTVSPQTGPLFVNGNLTWPPFNTLPTSNIPNYQVPTPQASTAPTPPNLGPPVGSYTQDPGVKTPYLYTANNPVQPPPIPVRRLFQVPDYYGSSPITGATLTKQSITISPNSTTDTLATPTYSNASTHGDPMVNALVTGPTLPSQSALANGGSANIDNPINLTIVPNAAATNPPHNYFGYNLPSLPTAPTTLPPVYDHRDHPYFRTEWLQRVANLTTVRTHQYAVWITVGFFEVITQGDASLASTNPALAYDVMGPELGVLDGKNERYRSFFLVDRTRATGFSPGASGDFRDLVVYRQDIQP